MDPHAGHGHHNHHMHQVGIDHKKILQKNRRINVALEPDYPSKSIRRVEHEILPKTRSNISASSSAMSLHDQNLTGPFTILEPHNQEIAEFYEAKNCCVKDFLAQIV